MPCKQLKNSNIRQEVITIAEDLNTEYKWQEKAHLKRIIYPPNIHHWRCNPYPFGWVHWWCKLMGGGCQSTFSPYGPLLYLAPPVPVLGTLHPSKTNALLSQRYTQSSICNNDLFLNLMSRNDLMSSYCSDIPYDRIVPHRTRRSTHFSSPFAAYVRVTVPLDFLC